MIIQTMKDDINKILKMLKRDQILNEVGLPVQRWKIKIVYGILTPMTYA